MVERGVGGGQRTGECHADGWRRIRRTFAPEWYDAASEINAQRLAEPSLHAGTKLGLSPALRFSTGKTSLLAVSGWPIDTADTPTDGHTERQSDRQRHTRTDT